MVNQLDLNDKPWSASDAERLLVSETASVLQTKRQPLSVYKPNNQDTCTHWMCVSDSGKKNRNYASIWLLLTVFSFHQLASICLHDATLPDGPSSGCIPLQVTQQFLKSQQLLQLDLWWCTDVFACSMTISLLHFYTNSTDSKTQLIDKRHWCEKRDCNMLLAMQVWQAWHSNTVQDPPAERMKWAKRAAPSGAISMSSPCAESWAATCARSNIFAS